MRTTAFDTAAVSIAIINTLVHTFFILDFTQIKLYIIVFVSLGVRNRKQEHFIFCVLFFNLSLSI